MTDRDRIHPNYRDMLTIPTPDEITASAGAVSDTQALLGALDPGARWSHALSREAYAGGSLAPGDGAPTGPDPQPGPAE